MTTARSKNFAARSSSDLSAPGMTMRRSYGPHWWPRWRGPARNEIRHATARCPFPFEHRVPGQKQLTPSRAAGMQEWQARLQAVLLATSGTATSRTVDLLEAITRELQAGDQELMWLTLAVLSGRLPDEPTLRRASRQAALDGPISVLDGIVSDHNRSDADAAVGPPIMSSSSPIR